uniref:C2H2-type domain-containing protein n=1 Tax=Plectus sambesii TaxID=2011161 RepID=A0A914V2E8_9BILA
MAGQTYLYTSQDDTEDSKYTGSVGAMCGFQDPAFTPLQHNNGTIINGNSYSNPGWPVSPEAPMRINLNMNLRMSPWISSSSSSSHAQTSSHFDYNAHHSAAQTTVVRSSGSSMAGLTSALFDPHPPVLTPCPTSTLYHAPQQHVRITNSPRLVGEQCQFLNAPPSAMRHQSFGQILPTTLASDYDYCQNTVVQYNMDMGAQQPLPVEPDVTQLRTTAGIGDGHQGGGSAAAQLHSGNNWIGGSHLSGSELHGAHDAPTTHLGSQLRPTTHTKRRPADGHSNPSAPHSCPNCNKQYCRKSTLKAHLRQHSGERPFMCPICGKTFSQAANLTAHKRVHTGEKPFSCAICLRPFSQSSSLVTHKRTHTGERPYPCPHCDKAFTDSSTLTKHMRTHTGQKPYGCPVCLMRFTQSGNLHRHMKTHREERN